MSTELEGLARLVVRPQLDFDQLSRLCGEIFTEVMNKGDEALLLQTLKYDKVNLNDVRLSQVELKREAAGISTERKNAIDDAYSNIYKFHKSQKRTALPKCETAQGVLCWQEARPIERVGLYIPGGSASLVSTALMLGVPAQIAGCSEVVVATPPAKPGRISPEMAYAFIKIDAAEVLTVGGIQAIAAFAVGTETIRRVDKIFGPGNQYIAAAKMYAQRYGVSVDMFAGPSEVMVIADESAVPAFVAADLLSQAEHGSDSQVMLLSDNNTVTEAVMKELKKQLKLLPRREMASEALQSSAAVVFPSITEAIEFANSYAPEHLILSIGNPSEIIKDVCSAGSVFLGNFSPESAGDYASGTNHTLPTGGWARSQSGLSVDSFEKLISFQKINRDGLERLESTITTLAQIENLQAHSNAVTIRKNRV